MKQLIYSVNNSNIIAIKRLAKHDVDSAEFVLINSPFLIFKHSLDLIKRFKLSFGLIKLLIKLISGRNQLYIVIYRHRIVSEGLISYGDCNHYHVNKNDCVIGPVNTNTCYQGKGFATFGLNNCLQQLLTIKSHTNVFIDTREDNYAMQKVIEKSGFNQTQLSYDRTPNKQL